MSWSDLGRCGSTGNATANSTAIACTLNGAAGTGAAVGDLLICAVAVQNASSVGNADEGAVTAISDTGSNTWVKIRERTANTGGVGGQNGIVCSLWSANVLTAMATTAVANVTFGSSASRDGQAMIVWRFSRDPAASVRVVDSTHVVVSTSLCGTLDLPAPTTTTHLRFRAVAAKSTLAAMTTTAGWTTIGTTRASAAVAVAVFGEFVANTVSSTQASAPAIATASTQASIYALFEENLLLGDGIF